MERIDTIIIGGGQAGLATSYCLQQHGIEHLVLERESTPAPVWKNQRWDSFTLVTPNWATRLPGAEYEGDDPDGFMTRQEIVGHFDHYVNANPFPIESNANVTEVSPQNGQGYLIETNTGQYLAKNVVMATGCDQTPRMPDAGNALSLEIMQLHSSQYRNPDQLPDGAVLVVGTAQSGTQIADELYNGGRKVYLSVSNAGRAPRRYRGRDIFAWLTDMGFFELPPDMMPGPPGEDFVAPHVSGIDGGKTMNLHQFARDGVTLLGHVRGTDEYVIDIAPDLHEGLARGDGFEQQGKQMIDGFIAKAGFDATEEELPQLRDGYEQPVVEQLNLKEEGIRSVIWATGYQHDYSMVKLPVTDAKGLPVQERGVTRHPGLYFVGIPFMPGLKTGILLGVGDLAAEIADRIAAPSQA